MGFLFVAEDEMLSPGGIWQIVIPMADKILKKRRGLSSKVGSHRAKYDSKAHDYALN